MIKIIGLLGILAMVVACKATYLDQARDVVSIGDTREAAIEALSVNAWYYQPCENRVTIHDLFFFGSHDYDEAEIVIVASEPDQGTYRVYDISSFESYAWHTAYADCIDRTRFEDSARTDE